MPSITQKTTAQCSNCNFTFKTLSEARSADLETRLRSNHGSSSLETIPITELLSDLRTDEARCETEISRLHSVIISLENKRLELQGRAKAYKSLLSPIRQLPVETLTEIFSLCSSMNEIGNPELPTLLVLGSVCAYWRKITLCNPKLWAAITLTYEFNQMDLLNVYLERSRQLPLILDVRCSDMMEAAAIARLIHHSRRWLDVVLYTGSVMCYRDMFKELDGNAPLLERLELIIENDGSDMDISLQSTPKLHTLSVVYPTLALKFPWEQLVHLSLSQCDVVDIMRILKLCRNLDRADVDSVSFDVDEEDEKGLDQGTSNLRIFSIEACDMKILPALFGAVALPLLENLDIQTDKQANDSWPELRDIFPSFLSRSSSKLTSFTLANLSIPPVDLLFIFRVLPLVTTLSVQETDITLLPHAVARPHTLGDIIFQSLNTHSTDSFDLSRTSLLPNLHTISLRARGESALSDQYFVDMVKSRWSPSETRSDHRGVACLRSVELRVLGRSFDMTKFEPLRHLAKAGMKIAIYDSGGLVH